MWVMVMVLLTDTFPKTIEMLGIIFTDGAVCVPPVEARQGGHDLSQQQLAIERQACCRSLRKQRPTAST